MKLWVALALVGLLAGPKPVTWTGAVAPGRVAPGGQVSVALTATIDAGWHLYSTTQPPGGPVPTRIGVASPGFLFDGTLGFPKPSVHPDPNFGINVETYEKSVTFTVPVRVDRTAPPGADTVIVTARYQACNATLCLPPQTAKVPVVLQVAKS
jgi:thiol:disulfide interchange protein DsbD